MTEDIIFARKGSLGLITLNRPQSLNALTLAMITQCAKQLDIWKEDEAVKAVVLTAAPGNAFCAGGDIRWLYKAGQENDPHLMQFFWHEYRLNHQIHQLSKPYIALMDGMTMGGGVGIGMHGSHPVASEQFIFAMPETSIGFFPDIGASYLLNRCPGSLGVYLGLTGNRLGPEDALKAHLVKHVIHSSSIPAVIEDLMQEDLSENAHVRVTECLDRHKKVLEGPSQIKPLIDRCFSLSTVELIRNALDDSEGAWAGGVSHALTQKSPLSLKVTLAQLHKTKGKSLAQCLKIDYDLASHFMKDLDFYEGVRALLVDKDKEPRWRPSHLEMVSDVMVDNYFKHASKPLEL